MSVYGCGTFKFSALMCIWIPTTAPAPSKPFMCPYPFFSSCNSFAQEELLPPSLPFSFCPGKPTLLPLFNPWFNVTQDNTEVPVGKPWKEKVLGNLREWIKHFPPCKQGWKKETRKHRTLSSTTVGDAGSVAPKVYSLMHLINFSKRIYCLYYKWMLSNRKTITSAKQQLP